MFSSIDMITTVNIPFHLKILFYNISCPDHHLWLKIESLVQSVLALASRKMFLLEITRCSGTEIELVWQCLLYWVFECHFPCWHDFMLVSATLMTPFRWAALSMHFGRKPLLQKNGLGGGDFKYKDSWKKRVKQCLPTFLPLSVPTLTHILPWLHLILRQS